MSTAPPQATPHTHRPRTGPGGRIPPMTSQLIVASTAAVHTAHPTGATLLTPTERTRADAFVHASDARDFIAAHLLVRHAVATATGTPLTDVTFDQSCYLCRSTDHGRPVLTHPTGHISWSHTRGVVAAAYHPRQPIGVDVECWDDQPVDADYLAGMLTSREIHAVLGHGDPKAQALHLWTQKEALVKADENQRLDDVIAMPLHVALRSTPGVRLASHAVATLQAVVGVGVVGGEDPLPAVRVLGA